MKNVVITGAGRGIGLALTLEFLKNYPNTKVLAISRNCDKLKPICRDFNTRLFVLPYDLEGVAKDGSLILKYLEEHFVSVNILINNAGKLYNRPLLETDISEVQEMFAVNVLAPGFLIKTLLPFFDTSTTGHILNIGSMGGLQGTAKFPGLQYYSASKAALTVLTECLAEELKELNISVNCIAPGAVQTEMLAEAFPGYMAPLSPEALAKFIAYFATTGASLMSGKVIPVSLSVP
jgi:short-subunit dehydrogenase